AGFAPGADTAPAGRDFARAGRRARACCDPADRGAHQGAIEVNDFARLIAVEGASLKTDDDFERINDLYLERGWADGLPIVPPTAQRVERMLAYCDRPWDEPVAKIAPRYGEATPLRLAANAVMAGCRPQYFPLYMLAVEAMCEEQFNLYGIQATTHPVA